MLGQIEVLFGHEYAFTEEVLVDLLAVGFGDKPGPVLAASNRGENVDNAYIVASSLRSSWNRVQCTYCDNEVIRSKAAPE